MEIIVCFLGAGLIIAFMMLVFDMQQSRRLGKVLKENEGVQPLFLLRSAEHKLSVLNAMLYSKRKHVQMDEGAWQFLSSQLSILIDEHKTGKITLKTYHFKLNELVNSACHAEVMNFEHVK